MPREDDFRRVAEDLRVLARSLARDFREAVDQSRAGGQRGRHAVRQGLRNVAEEARRGIRTTWTDLEPHHFDHHHRFRSWSPPTPPAGGPAPHPGAPAGRANRPRPPATPGWNGRHAPHRDIALPPIRHRWDTATIVGTLAVLFGVAWLLSALHAMHVSVEGVVAVGLMLLGASLIVTGRTDWSLSRRSWPVLLGLLLLVLVVASSATFGVGPALRDLSFGSKSVTVAHSGQQVSGGFGALAVDASGLSGGGSVVVSNVAGDVTVRVPPHLGVRLDARVLAGQICLLGREVGQGVAASAHQYAGPVGGPAQAEVDVQVHQLFGQIKVGGEGCSR